MKQIRILAATLLMLAGISVESLAQSPTIQKEVRLVESASGGTKYIGLKSNTPTASYTLILPDAAPTANKILQIGSVSGTNATATWADLPAAAWSLSGNANTDPSSQFIGTTDGQPLSIRTSATERILIAADGAMTLKGSATLTSTLGVTGATSLNSTLDVTGATTLTGLLTANGGATVVGATSITGATNINTTGAAATVIGNVTAGTAVTINTGTGETGGLILGGLQAGASTDEILVLGTGDKVGKLSMSALNTGLYRAKGTQTITTAAESVVINNITGLTDNDVINITLEGGPDMAIPSYYVGRSGTTITVYFSAAFTGKFNYAVIKN